MSGTFRHHARSQAVSPKLPFRSLYSAKQHRRIRLVFNQGPRTRSFIYLPAALSAPFVSSSSFKRPIVKYTHHGPRSIVRHHPISTARSTAPSRHHRPPGPLPPIPPPHNSRAASETDTHWRFHHGAGFLSCERMGDVIVHSI